MHQQVHALHVLPFQAAGCDVRFTAGPRPNAKLQRPQAGVGIGGTLLSHRGQRVAQTSQLCRKERGATKWKIAGHVSSPAGHETPHELDLDPLGHRRGKRAHDR